MKSNHYTSYILIFFLVSVSMTFAQSKQIQGFVTDGFERLTNVSVQVAETDASAKTDVNGAYKIKAEVGQTLVYSYPGKDNVEVIIEDVTQFLNIVLSEYVEELDEVVITQTKRKTQNELLLEYNTNKNLVKTAFGILDKNRVGYSLRIIDNRDFNLAAVDVVTMIENKIPGVRVDRSDPTRPLLYLPRRFNSLTGFRPAAFELDGFIIADAPTYIPIETIERIGIINSPVALAKYGTVAAGGLVVINTTIANTSPQRPPEKDEIGPVAFREHYLENQHVVLGSSLETPVYLEEIGKAQNRKEARGIFENLETNYKNSPYFYLDCFSYFSSELNDDEQARKIGDELWTRFSNDATILKALAYKMEAQGMHKSALEVYKDVFRLRPAYVQSYKNLASSYYNIGDFGRSATMHARYSYLVDQALLGKSDEFMDVMNNDFNNLLVLNGNQMAKYQKDMPFSKEEFDGTRLVFEWNDGEAEFDIQFVNPEQREFTWAHSLNKNPDRIKEEKLIGYSSEEYLIYKPMSGTWKVNIKYLGNKRLTPVYLKTTIYRNFNTPNQSKEIKVFKLRAKNVNQQLFALN